MHAAVVALLTTALLAACQTGSGLNTGSSEQTGTKVSTEIGMDVHEPPPGVKLGPAILGPPPDPSFDDLIYRIGPYDDLHIEVFGVPELSSDAQVNLQGLIVLPLVGPVSVSGLTPEEAEQAIETILASRYLRNPSVTVFVKNSASLNVTVSGAVGGQGVVPIRGRMTLSDVLARSGGVSPIGKKRQVVLYREDTDGQVKAYVMDYQKILDANMRDPLIVGNDRIYVPASGIAVFFSPAMKIFQTWLWPYRTGF
jgi:polysaccharide export outer membrane protein